MCLAASESMPRDAAVEGHPHLARGRPPRSEILIRRLGEGAARSDSPDTFTSFNEMTALPSAETINPHHSAREQRHRDRGLRQRVRFGARALRHGRDPGTSPSTARFETAGTITSIIDCGATRSSTPRDVYKEGRYAADPKRLESSRAAAQSLNDDRCAASAPYVQDPIASAVIGANGDRLTRVDALRGTHHWGLVACNDAKCPASWARRSSCDECEGLRGLRERRR